MFFYTVSPYLTWPYIYVEDLLKVFYIQKEWLFEFSLFLAISLLRYYVNLKPGFIFDPERKTRDFKKRKYFCKH